MVYRYIGQDAMAKIGDMGMPFKGIQHDAYFLLDHRYGGKELGRVEIAL